MAENSLSPGFVKLHYSRGASSHVATLPVIPAGTPVVGSEPSFNLKGGGTATFSAALGTFTTVFRPFFYTDVDFQFADFWSQPTPASDPIWVYTVTVGLPGTGTGSSGVAGQGVITLRTTLGGLSKIYMMEPYAALLTTVVQSYPFAPGGLTTLATFLTGSTSFIAGRDGGWLASPIKFTSKINDALRRKIYLQN